MDRNLLSSLTKSHSSPKPNDQQGKSLVPKELQYKEVKEKKVCEMKVQEEVDLGQPFLVASPQLQTHKGSISEKSLTKINLFEKIDKNLIKSTFATMDDSSECHI
jgi:hypothetical protein